tara:strand:+ start:556 stop:915 length:360 start_codon:yes stop_codon:yes gene_type:complete
MTFVYKEIDAHNLYVEFQKFGRADEAGFTLDAAKILHAHLVELAEDCETPIELDVIALCCEWTEYDDLAVIIDDYDLSIIPLYKADVDEDEYQGMVRDSMEEKGHDVLHDGGCCWVVSS